MLKGNEGPALYHGFGVHDQPDGSAGGALMVFVMKCTWCGKKCGVEVRSPQGRDPVDLEEFMALVAKMGLRCRVCGGWVLGSAEGE